MGDVGNDVCTQCGAGNHYHEPGCRVPPLGLKPRSVVDSNRLHEIAEAISRYAYSRKTIPDDWLHELSELNDRLAIEQRGKAVSDVLDDIVGQGESVTHIKTAQLEALKADAEKWRNRLTDDCLYKGYSVIELNALIADGEKWRYAMTEPLGPLIPMPNSYIQHGRDAELGALVRRMPNNGLSLCHHIASWGVLLPGGNCVAERDTPEAALRASEEKAS